MNMQFVTEFTAIYYPPQKKKTPTNLRKMQLFIMFRPSIDMVRLRNKRRYATHQYVFFSFALSQTLGLIFEFVCNQHGFFFVCRPTMHVQCTFAHCILDISPLRIRIVLPIPNAIESVTCINVFILPHSVYVIYSEPTDFEAEFCSNLEHSAWKIFET